MTEGQGRSTGASLAVLMVLSLTVGAFFVLRYLGYWIDSDTAFFVESIRGLQAHGGLDYPSAYPHGYAYPVWASSLSYITGLDAATLLQLFLPIIGPLLLVVSGFLAYRELLGSSRFAVLAGMSLLLAPELLYTVLRGTHEKLTVSLTLILVWLLLRAVAFQRARKWGLFVGAVILFYGFSYTLASLNAFFGSTFIISLSLGSAALVGLERFSPRTLSEAVPTLRRFPMIVATGWLLVAVVTWYVYPSAGRSLELVATALERMLMLVLSFEPVSSPYVQVGSQWSSDGAYATLSSFRWTLFAVSFVVWMAFVYRLIVVRWRPPLQVLVLIALYGALGFMLVTAVVVDLVGLSAGSNLQVRLYSYFVVLAAPMAWSAASAGRRSGDVAGGRVRSRLVALVFPPLFATFLGLSVLKATLDPVASNRWLFFSPSEITAMEFWYRHKSLGNLWVGPDVRLRSAMKVAEPDFPLAADWLAIQQPHDIGAVLRSPILEAAIGATRQVAPRQWQSSKVYSDGTSSLHLAAPSPSR